MTIGTGVTTIGKSAFSACHALTDLTIGTGVTTIGDKAFEACEALESVTIPDSVTDIGNSIFINCKKLTAINYRGTEAQWNDIKKGSSWDNGITNCTINCNYREK